MSTGFAGNDTQVDTLWRDLFSAHADVVLNGHDHSYQRYKPRDGSGNVDTVNGITEFVVGTGEVTHATGWSGTCSNVVIRDNTSWGVMKLTVNCH